jgi:hypothetical protein
MIPCAKRSGSIARITGRNSRQQSDRSREREGKFKAAAPSRYRDSNDSHVLACLRFLRDTRISRFVARQAQCLEPLHVLDCGVMPSGFLP